jgi:hypothetical protein
MAKFQVWSCKLVVAGDIEMPEGFDFPIRRAVINAVEGHGIEVLACFSGWAGTLTKTQTEIVERMGNR